jgi:methionyl aminopeptidase
LGIIIKSDGEVASMRQAGKVVAQVLELLKTKVEPGIKTKELDELAAGELKRLSAGSAFRGYRGFPANICVSINEQVVHGIPGEREIQQGDIVSLDIGSIVNGFYGDAAVTVIAGKASSEIDKLVETTREALQEGIKKAYMGARLGDISAAIQKCAESRGYSVVREYTGHGIGREMHEEPQVPNFGKPGSGPILKKGMVIALEPMLTMGDWRTKVGNDLWTVYTDDGSLAAHFEHTIAITDGEPEVLTAR